MRIDIDPSKYMIVDIDTAECFDCSRFKPIYKGDIEEEPEAVCEPKEECPKRGYRRIKSSFAFLNTHRGKEFLDGVSPADAARLVRLMISVNWSDSSAVNALECGGIAAELNVSTNTAYSFIRTLRDYFRTDDNDRIVDGIRGIYKVYGLKGKDVYTASLENRRYIKIYCDVYKDLYASVSGKRLSYVGYIVKLLPYLNIQWNVPCRNISEEEIGCAGIMGEEDIAEVLNVSVQHWKRNILPNLLGLRINADGESMPAIAVCGRSVVISPHLFYAGYRDTEVDEIIMGLNDFLSSSIRNVTHL